MGQRVTEEQPKEQKYDRKRNFKKHQKKLFVMEKRQAANI